MLAGLGGQSLSIAADSAVEDLCRVSIKQPAQMINIFFCCGFFVLAVSLLNTASIEIWLPDLGTLRWLSHNHVTIMCVYFRWLKSAQIEEPPLH